jgi:hypothetical protein
MANSSFLPEDYLEKRAQRRTNIVCVALFVVVLAGVLGVWSLQFRQKVELQTMQRNVNARFEEAAKRLEDLDQLQKQRAALIQKAGDVGMLRERLPRTRVMSELINAMPITVSLLELNIESKTSSKAVQVTTALDKAKAENKEAESGRKKKLKTQEVKQTDVTLNLIGVAPSDVQVAQYMSAVGQIPFLSDVNLVFTEELKVDELAMRKFRIDMRVNEAIELHKFEPTMVKRELGRNPMADSITIDGKGRATLDKSSGLKTSAVPVSGQ